MGTAGPDCAAAFAQHAHRDPHPRATSGSGSKGEQEGSKRTADASKSTQRVKAAKGSQEYGPKHALVPPQRCSSEGTQWGAVNATAVKQLAERHALLTLGAKCIFFFKWELVKAYRLQKTFDKECRRLRTAGFESRRSRATAAAGGARADRGSAQLGRHQSREGEMERSLQRAVELMP
eukprot:786766-Amphidinium_carterae.1